ncbi:MAG: hypothetical protein HYZ27_05965, partial [Deltaproteobacteria bacterium]|nr:hypothetical protein [Deltaproteobacteria bacterium]
MSVRWDPKIKSVTAQAGTPSAPRETTPTKAGTHVEPPLKPGEPREPGPAPTHPSRPGPAAQPSPLDHEIERLRQALRAGAEARLIAAKQALALALSYPLRRSRGARRTGVALSEEVATEAPELAAVEQQTAAWLNA